MSSVFTKLRRASWAAGTAPVCTPSPPPPPHLPRVYLCSFSFLALNGAQPEFGTAVCLLTIPSWVIVRVQVSRKQLVPSWKNSCSQHKHLKGKLTNWSVQIDFEEEKKKGLSSCWLLNVSLAIFNSLLETYILWEFCIDYTGSPGTETVFSLDMIPAITNRKHLEAKTWAIWIRKKNVIK